MKRFITLSLFVAIVIAGSATTSLTTGPQAANNLDAESTSGKVLPSPKPMARVDKSTDRDQMNAMDPSQAALIDGLRRAKANGNEQEVKDLLDRLGWHGRSMTSQNGAKAQPVVREELKSQGSRLGDDILVSDVEWSSGVPAMASRANGDLYIVVEDLNDDYLDIYRSLDDGYFWEYWKSLSFAATPTNPSIAIGEGNANRILIAYEHGKDSVDAALHVYWEDFDTQAFGTAIIQQGPWGWWRNPQICVDSPEYSNWWPYLTYAEGTLTKNGDPSRQDAYYLHFSRSLDYGVTWDVPTEFGMEITHEDQPDIDYGQNNLYITYTEQYGPGDRDIYVLRSLNLGGSWDPKVSVASASADEYEPRVAATNGGEAVVVAFTREYGATNTDIDIQYSTDAGNSWYPGYLPFSDDLESSVDLTTSWNSGKIHAAFWRDHRIQYTWADHAAPNVWAGTVQINEENAATEGIRPTVAVNPTTDEEGCVAWADERSPTVSGVYFDALYSPEPMGNYIIVVATPSLIASVEPLRQWKEDIGYNMTVVTLDYIYANYQGDDAARIWRYLHDYHQTTDYALLVGDVDLLPMRLLYPDGHIGWGGGYGTDYYYAEHSRIHGNWDLDGDERWGEFHHDTMDYHPEIIVGRLPFNDPTTVQNICSNIVLFEQDTGVWKRNAMLAHAFDNLPCGPTCYATDSAVTAEMIRNDFLVPQGWTATTLYEQGGIWPSAYPSTHDLGMTEFFNESGWGLNALISSSAHGNPVVMGGHRWLTDVNGDGYCTLPSEWCFNIFIHVGNVMANTAAGVVFLCGCSTGAVLGDDPGFAASSLRSRYLIRNPRNNIMVKEFLRTGASCVIGSTAGSDYEGAWSSVSDGGGQSLSYYFHEYLVGGGMRVGNAFFAAQVRYADDHRLQRGIRVFNLFGDPSLNLQGVTPPPGSEALAMLRDYHAPAASSHLDPMDIYPNGGGSLQGNEFNAASSAPAASKQKLDLIPTLFDDTGNLPGCASVMAMSNPIPLPGPTLVAVGVVKENTTGTQGSVFLSNGLSWSRTDIEGCQSLGSIYSEPEFSVVGGLAGERPNPMFGAIYRSVNMLDWELVASLPVPIPDPARVPIVNDIIRDAGGDLIAVTGGWGQVHTSSDNGLHWERTAELGAGVEINTIVQSSTGVYLLGLTGVGVEPIDPMSWTANLTDYFTPDGLDGVVAIYDIIEQGGFLFACGTAIDTGEPHGVILRSMDLSGQAWTRMTEIYPNWSPVAFRSLAAGPDGQIFAGADVGWGPATTGVLEIFPTGKEEVSEFGGLVDLANSVRSIVVGADRVYIGTGDNFGNVYHCYLGDASDVPNGESGPKKSNQLHQNYPNPFNPQTTIRYELSHSVSVRLSIYDLAGRLVRVINAGVVEQPGLHEEYWDGRNDAGKRLSSGTYFYRLEAGDLVETKRMTLVK